VVQQRTGNRSLNNAPRNTYLTKDDRWVAVSTSANSVAERLLTLVGHPEVLDEEWFVTGTGRAEHADELDAFVGAWIRERTRDEVTVQVEAAGAAVAPVYAPDELLADEHVVATDMIPAVPDDDLGEIRMQNVLFRMSETPGRIRFTGRSIGADTDEVLGQELGLAPERLAELRDGGVVR
jgi:crotonobetainyl-CoA:carnitine CoA-transferase CaiB-like acyl-CoA transferase